MDKEVNQLEKLLRDKEKIRRELESEIESQHYNDIIPLFSEYVYFRARQMLLDIIEKDTMGEFGENDLKFLENENKRKVEEIQELQKIRLSSEYTPEKLNEMIKVGSNILTKIQSNAPQGSALSYQKLVENLETEKEALKKSTESHNWYSEAIPLLSNFTKIDVNEGYVVLNDQYKLSIIDGVFVIDPNNIYIADLDVNSMQFSIATIMERIFAFNGLREIATNLKWSFQPMTDSPIIMLTPPGQRENAFFALQGYEPYILVEWGNVDTNEFNNDPRPTLQKLQNYRKKA